MHQHFPDSFETLVTEQSHKQQLSHQIYVIKQNIYTFLRIKKYYQMSTLHLDIKIKHKHTLSSVLYDDDR